MENLALVEITIIIVVVLVSIVVVKIGISFDINVWLKSRSEHRAEKLKMLCTHTEIKQIRGNKVEVESLFHSPPGTFNFICSRCQQITSDDRVPNELMEYFGNNPHVFFEKEKKFNKLARKMYSL